MANSLLNKFKNAFKKNKPFEPIMGEYEKPPRSTSLRHGHRPNPQANNTVRQNVPPVPPIPNANRTEPLLIPPRTSSNRSVTLSTPPGTSSVNHSPLPTTNENNSRQGNGQNHAAGNNITNKPRGLYVTNPDPVNTNESMSLSTNTRDSSIRTYNDISNKSSASRASNRPLRSSNESSRIEAPQRFRGQSPKQ